MAQQMIKEAQSQEEINMLYNGLDQNGRLTGYGQKLYAGQTFGILGINFKRDSLPETLRRGYTLIQPKLSLINISNNRSNRDFRIVDSHNICWRLNLPFKKNEP